MKPPPHFINNSRITHPPDFAKSKVDTVLQLALVVVLFLSSVIGNLCVCFLLLRYKKLRTIPNLFLGNLSTVNLLNTIINLPLLVMDNVVMSKEFKGKTSSWVTVLLYVTFIILNVYSMVLMMLERYIAIAFGMTYKAWITKCKAFIGIVVAWSLAIFVSLVTLLSVLNIDLGERPVHIYRGEYFKKAVRYCFLINVLFSIFGITILSALTLHSIKLQSLQVSSGDILFRKNAKRLHNHSVAVKSIIITTIAYALCFVPGIIFTAVTKDFENHHNHWRNFIIPLCVFFSNVIDPVVFISRSQTLMRALKRSCRRSPQTLSQIGEDMVASAEGNLKSEFPFRYNVPMSAYTIEPVGTREPSEAVTQRTLHLKAYNSYFL